MASLETENKALLVVLNQADLYYREQQRLAKTIRKARMQRVLAANMLLQSLRTMECFFAARPTPLRLKIERSSREGR